MLISDCIHKSIESCIEQFPQQVAVELGSEHITYQQLGKLTDVLAARLMQKGVGPDSIVALAMERSIEMVIAIVSVLKAGGAYLPIDASYPEERVQFILQDASPPVILANSKFEGDMSGFGIPVEAVDRSQLQREQLTTEVAPIARPVITGSNLAYVIYTSGSTGKPKGCLLQHAALVNRIAWMHKQYPINASDAVLQKTPYTFDVSVWEFMWPLAVGAKLVLAKPDGHKDNQYLAECMRKHGITVCHFVPSMLQQFLFDLDTARPLSLRHLFLSGEALPYELMEKGLSQLPGTAMHNLYGPTEAAIDVTYWDCAPRSDQQVPIGKAIDNIELFILNKHLQPVAPGEEGELHIGGVGLAKGYLNRETLTAERFFTYTDATGKTTRVYKTGDNVKMLSDGNIGYLGRLDFQVKVRGFRIELGEIESALSRQEGVRQAVVLLDNTNSEDPRLIAHLVADHTITPSHLRAQLKTELPEFMVPNRFVSHSEIPLTSHGKVDRNALQHPEKISSSTPGNESGTTEKVAQLVADHLDGQKLAADDDFFDNGATSFTLMRLARSINTAFGINVPVEAFLEAPTIAGVVAFIDQNTATSEQSKIKQELSSDPAPAASSETVNQPERNRVQKQIQEQCQSLLSLSDIDISTDLFDLGATSFTLMRLARDIAKELGVAVPVEAFLENPTIEGITGFIVAQLPDVEAGQLKSDTSSQTNSIDQIDQNLSATSFNTASQSNAQSTLMSSSDSQVELITQLCCELLNEATLPPDVDLFDIGATSFTLMRLAREITNKLSVAIPVEAFLENPTILGISSYIAAQSTTESSGVPPEQPTEASAASERDRISNSQPVLSASTAAPAQAATRNSVYPQNDGFGVWLTQDLATEKHPGYTSPDSRETELSATEPSTNTKVSIIGVSGRYAKTNDIWQLWEHLDDKQCLIDRFPQERWQNDKLHGGFLEDIAQFDNLLFGVTPPEARTMDPQERQFLEVVWECLESAGYTAEQLSATSKKVGVYVGVMWGDYQRTPPLDGEQSPTSNFSSIPSWISNFFNFDGPSMAIDTGCASPITALQMACESLQRGECEAAIVGGINLVSHPHHVKVLDDLQLLSHSPTCNVFGAEGDGWLISEGVGAILLRPAHLAQRDGDMQYASVTCATTSHRGKSRGRSMPNADGQANSLITLFEQAGISPEELQFVEASAAGTGISDAAEMNALNRVIGRTRTADNPYLVGAISGNLGHLESATALVQMTKVILQMQFDAIAPTLVPEELNPFIDWQNGGAELVTEKREWPSSEHRYSLVSGYSAEGVCAHAVLEQAPHPQISHVTRPENELIVLSAATLPQLQQQAKRLVVFIEKQIAIPVSQRARLLKSVQLADIAYTLQVGRSAMACRLAVVVSSVDELLEQLQHFARSGQATERTGIATLGAKQISTTDAVVPASIEQAQQSWLTGQFVNWQTWRKQINPGDQARKVPLPTYCFSRTRHWAGKKHHEGTDSAPLLINRDVNAHTSQSDTVATNSALSTQDVAKEAVTEIKAPVVSAETPGAVPLPDIQERVEALLCEIYAQESELPQDEVYAERPLDELGLNSLLITNVNQRMQTLGFGLRRRTLFFEFRSLADISEYLVQHHYDALQALFSENVSKPTEPTEPASDGAAHEGHAHTKVLAEDHPKGSSSSIRESEQNTHSDVQQGIAIVGMAGRFPGADTIDELWENIASGKNSITQIPQERWDWQVYFDQERGKSGFNYSRYGGFINHPDHFDPLFFNISPNEAELMDPQERCFLQITWAAIENAGWDATSLKQYKGVGVFVGASNDNYERAVSDAIALDPAARAQVNRYWSIANRVSYFLDIRGPSMAIDTACSSSLAAIHQACMALNNDDCEIALAGGVSLVLHPSHYIALSSLTLMSDGGICRPFGANADGTVIGEGVACLVLKPVEKAKADGDRIYAVIKGSAINTDGRTNGYTVANPQAQNEVIQKAMQRAGFEPRTMSYIEAHGTGTVLGDPIEVEGLTQAYETQTPDKQFCALGSVKSNIGHLESAAGVAGIVKLALQLQHKKLAPSLHCETPNEHIEFADTPFRLQRTLSDWERPVVRNEDGSTREYPRRAGISSFGAGGLNVHLVLEEHQGEPLISAPRAFYLIPLSARTADRLAVKAKMLSAYLVNHASLSLADIAYTLQTGRAAMKHRLVLIVQSVSELTQALHAYGGTDQTSVPLYSGVARRNKSLLQRSDEPEIAPEADLAQLRELAKNWVNGFALPWQSFWIQGAANRIPLPVYPFEPKPYWIGGAENKEALIHRKGSAVITRSESRMELTQSAVSSSMVQPEPELPQQQTSTELSEAQSTPLSANKTVTKPAISGLVEPVLVEQSIAEPQWEGGTIWVLDNSGVACESLAKVSETPLNIVQIKSGTGFEQHGTREFTIDSTNMEHYQRLITVLLASKFTPKAIVNCWIESGFSEEAEKIETQLNQGFYSWIHILQSLLQKGYRQPTRLAAWYFNTNAFEQPAIHAQESLFRSVRAECAWVTSTVLVTPLNADNSAKALLHELSDSDNDFVKYQEGKRWVKDYRQISKSVNAPDLSQLEHRDAVYVITGGAGGIGLRLVQEILSRVKARVAILGRSPANHHITQLLKRENNLMFCQVDVGDRVALKSALEQIRLHFGSVTHVYHCAAVLDLKGLPDKKPLDMSSVLAAKVYGTINLDLCTADDPIEHFCLFSSISSEVGAPGQTDYAYANGFMDSFAAWRDNATQIGSRQGQTISVNWPFWKDGGMEMDPELLSLLEKKWGIQAIDFNSGFSYLFQLRQLTAPQVLVLPGEPEKIAKTLGLTAELPVKQKNNTQEQAPSFDLTASIVNAVSAASKIGIEEIDTDIPLSEYGFDSIMLTGLSVSLSELLNVDLTPSDLIEYATIDDLADYLRQSGMVSTNENVQQEYAQQDSLAKPLVLPNSEARLLEIVSELSKIPATELDADTPLSEYGFDSISLTRLSVVLSEQFDCDVTPSDLIEHETLHDIRSFIATSVSDEAVIAAEPMQSSNIKPNNRSTSAMSLRHVLLDEAVAISKIPKNEFDPDSELAEYGFDSIMLTRLSVNLSERFDVDITPADLIEYPSLAQLEQYLLQMLPDGAVASLTAKEEQTMARATEPALSHLPESHLWFANLQALASGAQSDTISTSLTLDGDQAIFYGHCVNKEIVMPGAGYVEIARAAAAQIYGGNAFTFSNVSWMQPLKGQTGSVESATLTLNRKNDSLTYSIAHAEQPDRVYSRGKISVLQSRPTREAIQPMELMTSLPKHRSKVSIYKEFEALGLDYGEMYQSIDDLYSGSGQALARLTLTGFDTRSDIDTFRLHPVVLDGAFQAALGATVEEASGEYVRLPYFVKQIRQFNTLPRHCWVHVKRCDSSTSAVEKFDMTLFTDGGEIVAEVDHFTVRPLKRTAPVSLEEALPKSTVKTANAENVVAPGATGRSFGEGKHYSGKVAVIGVSGRFPESEDVESFWEHLKAGDNLVSEVSQERWDWRAFFDKRKGIKGKTYANWAGYAPGVLDYDPAFFRISEAEAKSMDLQHLLVLELTQQLLDSTGYTAKEIAGQSVAVMVGAAATKTAAMDSLDVDDQVAKSAVVLSIQNMIAARVSDFYDLRGEAFTIDTACSSALVSIHKACRELLAGDCDMAIAGGVYLLLDERAHILYSQASVLSDEPRSFVFDKRAKGFVLGEGAGLTMLKRYEDAIEDGDNILAVVAGSATNNDGRTMGITTPNFVMQRAAISKALTNASVDPRTIEYLEAHGTGTLLGDPIEIKAATQAYREYTDDLQFCSVGSVKTNMGHSLMAAGAIGFIKLVKMLQHKYIPKTLHCETPHPRFEFDKSPFKPALQGAEWKTSFERRRAAISGFGFGGTNCHMILEEFVPEGGAYTPRRHALPPTQFNRIRCWHRWVGITPWQANEEAIPDQQEFSKTQTATHEQAGAGGIDPQITTHEQLIDALQSGRIDMKQAMLLEKSIA